MPILSRAANGDIVKNGVVNDARTAPYLQTDLSLGHEVKVSKTHEGMRLKFVANASNLFNQHAATAFYQFAIPTNLVSPTRVTTNSSGVVVPQQRFAGDPSVDWGKVMNGYNYIDALNGKGAFAGSYSCPTSSNPNATCAIQSPLTMANRFGKPQVFQSARVLRLEMHFVF